MQSHGYELEKTHGVMSNNKIDETVISPIMLFWIAAFHRYREGIFTKIVVIVEIKMKTILFLNVFTIMTSSNLQSFNFKALVGLDLIIKDMTFKYVSLDVKGIKSL